LLGLALLLGPLPAGAGPPGPQAAPPKARAEIATAAEFEALAVPLDGTSYVKFVIEAKSGRVHFLWTALFPLHYQYVNEVLLSGSDRPFADALTFAAVAYHGDERPYIVGALRRVRGEAGLYEFQYLEQDQVTRAVLARTWERLGATFRAGRLRFRPLDEASRALAAQVPGLPLSPPEAKPSGQGYQLLNAGRAVGVLTVVPPGTDFGRQRFPRDRILVLAELPVDLGPVAGLLSGRFAPPLSHVNLRARAWGIPCAAQSPLPAQVTSLDGRWVVYEAKAQGIVLRAAGESEIRAAQAPPEPRSRLRIPVADPSHRELAGLEDLGPEDAPWAGAKAANLGPLFRARGELFDVPAGFVVPCGLYREFLTFNRLSEATDRLATDLGLARSDDRCRALQGLQETLRSAPLQPTLRAALKSRRAQFPQDRGMFVRSSTNAEDLEGFNGAGLYETVPNVRGEEALEDAVRRVWASVWNCRAYDERSFWGIDHAAVCPAVLLQLAQPAEAAGVLVTKDLRPGAAEAAYTINARRGLGHSVVEGSGLPEQVVFFPSSDRIERVGSADGDAGLALAEQGGVQEKAPGAQGAVLDDAAVRALGAAATRVLQLFPAGAVLDIEWVLQGTRIVLVQARPYVEPGQRPPQRPGPSR